MLKCCNSHYLLSVAEVLAAKAVETSISRPPDKKFGCVAEVLAAKAVETTNLLRLGIRLRMCRRGISR